MDDPHSIVEGALGHHIRMINEFKGVPGVMPERLAEGMQVMTRHVPVSWVGTRPQVSHCSRTSVPSPVINYARHVTHAEHLFWDELRQRSRALRLCCPYTAEALRAIPGG